jgi:hypothetical protein
MGKIVTVILTHLHARLIPQGRERLCTLGDAPLLQFCDSLPARIPACGKS